MRTEEALPEEMGLGATLRASGGALDGLQIREVTLILEDAEGAPPRYAVEYLGIRMTDVELVRNADATWGEAHEPLADAAARMAREVRESPLSLTWA